MSRYKSLAKVYDILNYDCDYEKWSQYLLELLKLNNVPSGHGLDLGCGSGQITNHIANYGYKMVGVDLSDEMLNEALKIKQNNNVVFLKNDMLKIDFEKRFNFINITCDGVNYINPKKEFDVLLQNVSKHLRKNGLFMFDVSSSYKLKNILGNNIFTDDTNEATYIWQNDFDEKNNILNFILILFMFDGKTYNKTYEEHTMYCYNHDDIVNSLESNGFSDIKIYDAFTLDKHNKESLRLQVVCKKG